jgi:eukaryotic-like serine/threonine-protein kinase
MDNQIMKIDCKTKRREMRKLIITAIAISLVALLFAGCDTNANSPVTLKWCFKTEHHVFSNSFLTVVGDVVYVGGHIDYIYAVDKDTGEQRWRYYYKSAFFSTPSVVDGVVYVGVCSFDENEKGYLYAIDATSGKLKWYVELEGSLWFMYSPTVVDGTVYIGSRDYHLYAIDAESGEFKWRFVDEFKRGYESGDILITSAPSFANDVVCIASGNVLYAIDANSGELKWRFQMESQITTTPLVVNGVVYVGGDDYYLYALDSESGVLKRRYEKIGYASSFIIVDDIIYFGGKDDNCLYAKDTNTGELKWRFETRDIITASPTVVDGVIYMGESWFYSLYALDSKSGELKWKYKAKDHIDSNIIIDDGVIYYGCRDGYLYALKIKKE